MKTPLTIWFTGLPGAGKTTLSRHLFNELKKRDITTVLLDGDNIRHSLNSDLGFTESDRRENIRRVAELSKLLLGHNISTINAFITPTESIREMVRTILSPDKPVEIFLDTPLKICEQRDPKGMYSKARKGLIRNFTGVDATYEIPAHSSLTIHTGELTIEESMNLLLDFLDRT